MGNKHYEYTDKYNFLVSCFMFFITITIAFYAIGVSNGGDTMTTLAPIILIMYTFAMASIVGAIYYGIRIWRTPKDYQSLPSEETINTLTRAIRDLRDLIEEIRKDRENKRTSKVKTLHKKG